MKLTPEQQKERDAILADMEVLRKRVDVMFDPKPWPQNGDLYLFIDNTGTIANSTWTNDVNDRDRNMIGNIYHPDRQAYALRHYNAMCVLTSLRAMPGRTAPPNNDGCHAWCILRNIHGRFDVASATEYYKATVALGGVWFGAKESATNALNGFRTDQLETLWDDHLQTPIEEDGGV